MVIGITKSWYSKPSHCVIPHALAHSLVVAHRLPSQEVARRQPGKLRQRERSARLPASQIDFWRPSDAPLSLSDCCPSGVRGLSLINTAMSSSLLRLSLHRYTESRASLLIKCKQPYTVRQCPATDWMASRSGAHNSRMYAACRRPRRCPSLRQRGVADRLPLRVRLCGTPTWTSHWWHMREHRLSR